MAARVGTCAQSSLIAAQLLRVREAWPDVWARTGRVQVASAFLCSMMCGSWVGMNEPEACATGMWVHGTSSSPGHWDEGVLEIMGGNREEGRRIRNWLGEVDLSGGSRKIGMVSRYLVDSYRFDHGKRVCLWTRNLTVCLTPTLRHDRHALCPGHALFVPFTCSPTRRCCLATGANGLPHGIRTQLRSLPPFQPISSPRPGPKRETQIYRFVDEQVLFALCLPWPHGLTIPVGMPMCHER
jgi:hypothetical protein